MTRAASPREIARMFSVSPTKVYRAIREGYVGSHSLGRTSLVFVDDFEAYLRNQPATRSSKRSAEACHA